MGVCLDKNCIKGRQQKIKDSIDLDVNENKINNSNNNNEEKKEKPNCLEENQLTDANKNNQNVKNEHEIIYYNFKSKYKSKLVNHSKNGHLSNSNNYSNNNYINIINNDNCDNLIHFTNFIDKKINNVSRITNTTTK